MSTESSHTATANPVDPRIRRSLNFSTCDGVFYTLMAGMGEAFIIPLAIRKGFNGLELGILGSFPMFFGAFTQCFSGVLLKHFQTRKRMVITLGLLQGCVFLALCAMVKLDQVSFWLYLFLASIFSGAILALGPAWNSWIGDLTESVDRNRYFSQRGQILNTAHLVAFMSGGVVMRWFENAKIVETGFITVFILAFFARLVSLSFISMQYEPPLRGTEGLNLKEFWKEGKTLWQRPESNLIVFMVAFNAASFFSQAAFAPYMLTTLKFDYATFTMMNCAVVAGKILFFPVAAKLARNYGERNLLLYATISLALLAFVWLLSGQVWYLLGVQILSGFAWSCFELSNFNLMLNSTHPDKRVSYFAWYNTLNGGAQVVSSGIGGYANSLGLLSWTGLIGATGLLRLGVIGALRSTFAPEAGAKEATPLPESLASTPAVDAPQPEGT